MKETIPHPKTHTTANGLLRKSMCTKVILYDFPAVVMGFLQVMQET